MPTNSPRDNMVTAIAVIILLIGTATGNSYVMLGISVTALLLLPQLFYRRRMRSRGILAAFLAAVIAAVIGIIATKR